MLVARGWQEGQHSLPDICNLSSSVDGEEGGGLCSSASQIGRHLSWNVSIKILQIQIVFRLQLDSPRARINGSARRASTGM